MRPVVNPSPLSGDRVVMIALLLVSACANATGRPPVVAAAQPIPPVQPAATLTTVEPPVLAPPASAPPAPLRFDIGNASATWDFRLSLHQDCSPDRISGGICEAPGELVILPKGSDVELQRVQLESVDVVQDDHGQPMVNSSEMYDYQGTLQVGDFDFDGHEDFAVQDSQDGPYGGPTFQVFLYRPRERTFVRSGALTDLTRETLGFFQVDAARKRLVTMAKSGCCYHVTEKRAVVRGALVLVSRFTEDATGDAGVVETTEVLRGGKWVKKVVTAPRTP